eukprot:782678-Rhodomonas_salina.3
MPGNLEAENNSTERARPIMLQICTGFLRRINQYDIASHRRFSTSQFRCEIQVFKFMLGKVENMCEICKF